MANLCQDHDSLHGFAQVVLNSWTTALHVGTYTRETNAKHTQWLVEITETIRSPPVTRNGLFAATLQENCIDALEDLISVYRSNEKFNLWLSPQISKKVCETVQNLVRKHNFSSAKKIIFLILSNIPCSFLERIDFFRGILNIVKFSESEEILTILGRAIQNYPDAPVAKWHGLSEKQLEEVKCFTESEVLMPTTQNIEAQVRKICPFWVCTAPFDVNRNWSIAWKFGEKWIQCCAGVPGFVAEHAIKPQKVLKFLIEKGFTNCTRDSYENYRRASFPIKITALFSYASPFSLLFERLDELKTDEVCDCVRMLSQNLPCAKYPGYQELDMTDVKDKIEMFWANGLHHNSVGPITIAATIVDEGKPWVAYSTQPNHFVCIPLHSLQKEQFKSFSWLRSQGSIVENSIATKVALKKPKSLESARKIVSVLNSILPKPRVGWTSNLFDLSPSPAAALALIENGHTMNGLTCQWKYGAVTNVQREANIIVGLLFCVSGAKIEGASGFGTIVKQFINDTCGNFTEEDLFVDQNNGSLTVLADLVSGKTVSNWTLNAENYPLLLIVGLAVATFHSKHRGNAAQGLIVANTFETFLKNNKHTLPHFEKILSQNPCLENPSLWFTPYRLKNHSLYPKHIRDAVRTVFLSLRRLSQTGVVPFLPTEIILLILGHAGYESFALGKAPPLVGENNSIIGTAVFDWICHKSRITRHGTRHASIWNMF